MNLDNGSRFLIPIPDCMRSMLTLKSLTNCLLTGLVILLKIVAKSSFITKYYSLEKTTCRYFTSPVSDAIELFFPALAADLGNGAKVFSANCASCHMGVKTSSMLVKPLKNALAKYGMDSLKDIKNQVSNGKSAMPAFKNKLSDKQIEDVATYVL